MNSLPTSIPDETTLETLLSEPSEALVEAARGWRGDVLVLGVAGKMGLTLARMARRAIDAAGSSSRVIGVARFSTPGSRESIEQHGIESIAADLLDRNAVEKLPEAANVIFMAGKKFGAEGNLDETWAMNVRIPHLVSERYPKSRTVVFSTGCVYPFVFPSSSGCSEETPPAPVGEYAQSCLGRERVFGYASRTNGTPVCLFRLNYAIDLRYGVLHDIAAKVWARQPVDVSMGWFNAIWQRDANEAALRCLDLCSSPAEILNVTGPETLSVRKIAQEFGGLFDLEPAIVGVENESAYLNDARKSFGLFGYPSVSLETMMRWTASWIRSGGRSLNKPTHFEVRDGRY